MPGVKPLRKLYIGKEASTDQGTGVAATSQLFLDGLWKDDRVVTFSEQDDGYLPGRNRTYTPYIIGHMTMEGPATYEQLPYILEAGVKATTPTTDSGSGYIYSYVFPLTSQGTLNTYTIEGGDDQQEEEASYCFVESFTLTGVTQDVWKLSANWVGRQVAPSTFTPSSDVTVSTVDEMLFQKSKLYIDPTTDTIGTTQKTLTFLGGTLSVVNGYMPYFTGDGNLYFSGYKQGKPVITLAVTFEHDGTAVAEKAAFRAETPRQIRLLVQGSTLTTSGTYSVRTFIADLAGTWESFEVLGEQNGNDIVAGTFMARYDANADLFAEFLVVNELSALP